MALLTAVVSSVAPSHTAPKRGSVTFTVFASREAVGLDRRDWAAAADPQSDPVPLSTPVEDA
jgi:hypothetical protein